MIGKFGSAIGRAATSHKLWKGLSVGIAATTPVMLAGSIRLNQMKASGAFDAFRFPAQGMGMVGSGPGYNAVYKKPGSSMPASNLGATGDLTMALHTNRHGYGI